MWVDCKYVIITFGSIPKNGLDLEDIRCKTAEALTAQFTNKKAQARDSVGPRYVTSLPKGSNLADIG